MKFFLANLFYIVVVLIFIGSLVFRYFVRKRSRKRKKTSLNIKPDDERRLRFEKLKSTKLGYVGENIPSESVAVSFNDKFDELSKRSLESLKLNNFHTDRLGKEEETQIIYDEESGVEKREAPSCLRRIDRLPPLVQRFIWKEILDRPRADNPDVHWF